MLLVRTNEPSQTAFQVEATIKKHFTKSILLPFLRMQLIAKLWRWGVDASRWSLFDTWKLTRDVEECLRRSLGVVVLGRFPCVSDSSMLACLIVERVGCRAVLATLQVFPYLLQLENMMKIQGHLQCPPVSPLAEWLHLSYTRAIEPLRLLIESRAGSKQPEQMETRLKTAFVVIFLLLSLLISRLLIVKTRSLRH